MKYQGFIAAVLSAAVAVTATHALADRNGGRHQMPTFQELDTDGNGEITQEEMAARGAARFAANDTDGDGFLTQEEIEAAAMSRAADRAARMIERMDANNDGKLALDELKSRTDGDRMFDRVDADDSGSISEEEFAKMQDRMKQRHGKKSGPMEGGSD